jgi:hypothetical protein
VTAEIESDHPVMRGEVAQLMGPQRPAEHEAVEEHDGRALTPLDHVHTPTVVHLEVVLDAVLGDGQALGHDLVGRCPGTRHRAVLRRPPRRQCRPGAGGHAAHQPAPVQRSLLAHG